MKTRRPATSLREFASGAYRSRAPSRCSPCPSLAPSGDSGDRLSIAALVSKACAIHPDTADEARSRLRVFGFLDWERRLRRDAATGWRAEQTSNAYRLLVPACDPDFPRVVPLRSSKREISGIENLYASAARQPRAMNCVVPAEWGNV